MPAFSMDTRLAQTTLPKMFKSISLWIENGGITFASNLNPISQIKLKLWRLVLFFIRNTFTSNFSRQILFTSNLCLALLIYESKCTNSIKFSRIPHHHFNEVLMHQTVSTYVQKETKKQCTLVHIGTELSVMKRENLSCTAFFFSSIQMSMFMHVNVLHRKYGLM